MFFVSTMLFRGQNKCVCVCVCACVFLFFVVCVSIHSGVEDAVTSALHRCTSNLEVSVCVCVCVCVCGCVCAGVCVHTYMQIK